MIDSIKNTQQDQMIPNKVEIIRANPNKKVTIVI